MKQLVLSPEAYIGVQKNRKKAYANNVIYLDNNQEFQIELYNPTSNVLGAEIWLNDALSSTSKLVLKPGERVWIDRYLDTNKKYLFNTYEIKDTKQNQEAIKNNGKVTIKFYKESNYINGITWTNTTGNFYPQTYPTYPTYYTYASADTGTISDTGTIFCSSTTNIDTGRVEKGKESKQKFESVSYEFDSSPTEIVEYHLMPTSQKKTIETDELKKFCTSCGMRIRKSTWTFCPTCGEKL